MKSMKHFRAQRGTVVWAVLIFCLLIAGTGYFLARCEPISRETRESKSRAALMRAKEALLARALLDENRPGSLPCPDHITDNDGLDNHPGDGKADMLAGNHCPDYLGWLPWQTLDLPELEDASGNRLWYALAPELRDDDSAQPVNAETSASLLLAGHGDIAAIIFAGGSPLGSQHRPSAHPADHLESLAGSGRFIEPADNPDSNDLLLPISRSELMSVVGRRVAGEVRRCLDRHAAASDDGPHRYPWPAPIGNLEHQGKSGSLFGRIPRTQPGSGTEPALAANEIRLLQASEKLLQADSQTGQLEQLEILEHAGLRASHLMSALHAENSRLKAGADAGIANLHQLNDTILQAGENARISRSEGSEIRAGTETITPALDSLLLQLRELGNDPYPWLLKTRITALNEATTAGDLFAQGEQMLHLLSLTHSMRSEVAMPLSSALQLAVQATDAAGQAAAHPENSGLLDEARNQRNALAAATMQLAAAIAGTRVNLLASDLAYIPETLTAAISNLQDSEPANTPLDLIQPISLMRNDVAHLETGIGEIVAARQLTLTALDSALATCANPLGTTEQIRNALLASATQSLALVKTMQQQETLEDNLSISGLSAALEAFRTAGSEFSTMDTANPRPLQSSIVLPAREIARSGEDVIFWLELISGNTRIGAPLARAEAAPAGQSPASSPTLAGSAFFQSEQLLGHIARAKKLAGNGNQASFLSAISTVAEDARELAHREQALRAVQTSSRAAAFPTLWNSPYCEFLRPENNSWWQANHWDALLFYQISSPQQALPGTLSVNHRGQYSLVVLVAGPVLPGQERSQSTTANYLESTNASSTRDGDATSPSLDFAAQPAGTTFNDRLSY